MQLWFGHGGKVSIREQLVTQVVLGILSDDSVSGQRLPSTRELARRFHLHPNTVSAGYRQLERERWVEFRHGSGVYVRETKPEVVLSPALALDQIVANLFRSARELGVPLAAVRSRIRHWLDLQPPDHFLLIEPDEELRKIVATEMRLAATLPIRSCDFLKDDLREATQGAIVVALPSRRQLCGKLCRREPSC
jgi:DNA-binding transcriptional regulator YhcF (GntR family)